MTYASIIFRPPRKYDGAGGWDISEDEYDYGWLQERHERIKREAEENRRNDPQALNNP